jgi:hypothetical protein
MRCRVSEREPSGAFEGGTSTFEAGFSLSAAVRATSARVTRGPDAVTLASETSCSRANRRADGVAEISDF